MRAILCLLLLQCPILILAQHLNLSVPELVIPARLKQWQTQRKTIRETLVRVLGDITPLPKVTEVRVHDHADKGSYIQEIYGFESEAVEIMQLYILIHSERIDMP